ncbi:PRTRC system protein C [Granulicella sp. WH15]|uniref:PRTRC system protein C n=1 Tax=Granulicella sp. WH15 TaxID=2602070 RepID=UPI00136790D5|nr:PRTRC system protein C [Granulicella sp. WH15]QHN03674.1 PRTRC system protein C [Granulicella sp. WH15]
MAGLAIALLPREFSYQGTRIPNPNPAMNLEQVQDFLTAAYPEIATAKLVGPEETGVSDRREGVSMAKSATPKANLLRLLRKLERQPPSKADRY